GEWPTEWSPASLGGNLHQLWNNVIGATGWDGPYIDRPILQDNRWGGNWGVYENRRLDLTDTDNSDAGDPLFTALLYDNVPYKVCLDIDKAMDDGAWNTGAVQ
ncbi:hypothetical protein M1N13_03330, partial [Dehalococcoidia bacterium]|nr:hypothetical protein [Dehalococcoidia bacterium]